MNQSTLGSLPLRRVVIACAAFQACATSGLSAQAEVRWWEAAAAVGVVAGASVFDRGIDAWMQNHRTGQSDAWARAFRHGGQPEVILTVGGGILAAGVVRGRADWRRSGGRILVSVLSAGLVTETIKEVTGRVRPVDSHDPYVFRPFTRHDSFPSGHTTLAFAFATSLGEEIHNDWIRGVLLAGAAGTGWSRLNDQRHWFSDVLAGAAVGVTAAKIVEGRWRIFGLGPPKILVEPNRTARIEWSVRF